MECTSETAANLSVWTDRELIRIILDQKKWNYSQGKLIVCVSFCLEGLFCWLKFLVVSKAGVSHITEEIPLSHMEGVGQ